MATDSNSSGDGGAGEIAAAVFRSLQVTLFGDKNRTYQGVLFLLDNLTIIEAGASVGQGGLGGIANESAASSASSSSVDLKGNANNAENPLGAAYYVVAVILIYALSIVMLIASRVRRKHAKILEDRQIHKYLQEFQTVREKSHRDTYRNLKRMVIARLGPNRVPKTAYCNLSQAIMPAVAVAMPSSTEVQRMAGGSRSSGSARSSLAFDDSLASTSAAMFASAATAASARGQGQQGHGHGRRPSMTHTPTIPENPNDDCTDNDVSDEDAFGSSFGENDEEADEDDGRGGGGGGRKLKFVTSGGGLDSSSNRAMVHRGSLVSTTTRSSLHSRSRTDFYDDRLSTAGDRRSTGRRPSTTEVVIHRDSMGGVQQHASRNVKDASSSSLRQHHLHHLGGGAGSRSRHGSGASRQRRNSAAYQEEEEEEVNVFIPIPPSPVPINGRLPAVYPSSVSSDNYTISRSETPSKRRGSAAPATAGDGGGVRASTSASHGQGHRNKRRTTKAAPSGGSRKQPCDDDIDYADDSLANDHDLPVTSSSQPPPIPDRGRLLAGGVILGVHGVGTSTAAAASSRDNNSSSSATNNRGRIQSDALLDVPQATDHRQPLAAGQRVVPTSRQAQSASSTSSNMSGLLLQVPRADYASSDSRVKSSLALPSPRRPAFLNVESTYGSGGQQTGSAATAKNRLPPISIATVNRPDNDVSNLDGSRSLLLAPSPYEQRPPSAGSSRSPSYRWPGPPSLTSPQPAGSWRTNPSPMLGLRREEVGQEEETVGMVDTTSWYQHQQPAKGSQYLGSSRYRGTADEQQNEVLDSFVSSV